MVGVQRDLHRRHQRVDQRATVTAHLHHMRARHDLAEAAKHHVGREHALRAGAQGALEVLADEVRCDRHEAMHQAYQLGAVAAFGIAVALEQLDCVIDDILERHEKGQPVLVGTVSVEKSELLSRMMRERGIDHEVLNAKQHTREAEIVSQAGRLGSVTVATNMAGRGVDIVLGGNPELLARREVLKEGFDEALSSQVPWRAPLLADGGPQAAFEPGKDLRALTAVWDVVCGVDTVVETLAQSVGLGGDDRDPPGYQPPMRFIDGAYLPSLVENHGRVIVELRGLLEARAEADAVLQAEALAARWDAAAPDG